jgi:hypothetical protein
MRSNRRRRGGKGRRRKKRRRNGIRTKRITYVCTEHQNKRENRRIKDRGREEKE